VAQVLLVGVASAARTQVPPTSIPVVSEITPEVEQAVNKGLAWLAGQQKDDGSFGSGSTYGKHVGITGLACMAFMCDGHHPGRGKYGHVVDKGVRFVLSCGAESGLLAAETSHGPMYGHGFATLFLAEVHGMSPAPELREKLRRAIRLIIRTQNDQGGWRYQPVKSDADISVTICQIMALRAAKNAGIAVPKSTIDRAISYVRRSQNPDGGFRYMLSPGASGFARSGAGVAALYYAGIYEDEAISRGLSYMEKFRPGDGRRRTPHYYYGQYYAIQAMYMAGGKHWEDWWPAIRDDLLRKQEPEGPWRGEAGREYGTSMALIILQVPKRLLPIFQR
jgi:hypothetical protein